MAFTDRLHNRGSISTGYDIDNSLKFEADNSEYAEYAITSTTDRRNFCFSGWVKRTELVNATDGGQTIFGSFTEGNEGVLLRWSRENSNYYDGIQVDIGQGGTNYRSYTSSLYRDTSAWYHIVLAVNTRENTASDRWKLYVNGEQVTSWAQQQFPTADFLTSANLSGSKHTIGAYETGGTVYGKHCGYFADFHFIDADQGNVTFLPTDFGEFDEDSGIWKPKAYTGSYGTNGFYLDFESSGSLGADSSGNGNNFTLNNITSADQATDTPTNNFAILSQSMQGYYEDLWSVISEGGTKFRCTEFDAWITTVSSIGVTKGKWYAEFKITGARPNNMFGIASMEQLDNNSGYIYGGRLGESGESWGIGYYQANGNLMQQQNSGYTLISGWGSSISQLATVGIAVDMDNHNLYLAVNNTYQNSGDPTSGATGTGAISFDATETVAIATTGYSLGGGNDTIVEGNFGGFSATSTGFTNTDANGYGTFKYAPPSGYYALCSKNLAEYG
jgi:hypothetical protein